MRRTAAQVCAYLHVQKQFTEHTYMPDEPLKPVSRPQRAPSIAIAFRTLGRTLRHGYDNLGTLLMVSALWWIGAVLILPLGTITAALHRVTKPMTEERAASWRSFFDHLRADLGWSSALMATLVFGFLLIQLNLQFYSASSSATLRILTIAFLTCQILWTGIMLYAFPLSSRQEDRRLRTTLRNAAVMVMSNAPGVLVSILLLGMLVALLTVLPPLFVLIPGVVALWSQENVRLLLVAGGYIAKDEFADRERPRK